jgi:hypothetical protein
MRVVTPVLDRSAAERARLANAARAALLGSGGAVTLEQFADSTRRTPGAARQWVQRHRSAGKLITVTHDGILLIPTFQLTEAFEVDRDVSPVVVALTRRGMDGWAVWDWFVTPNTWLDRRAPIRLVRSRPSDVLRAVAGLFQE